MRIAEVVELVAIAACHDRKVRHAHIETVPEGFFNGHAIRNAVTNLDSASIALRWMELNPCLSVMQLEPWVYFERVYNKLDRDTLFEAITEHYSEVEEAYDDTCSYIEKNPFLVLHKATSNEDMPVFSCDLQPRELADVARLYIDEIHSYNAPVRIVRDADGQERISHNRNEDWLYRCAIERYGRLAYGDHRPRFTFLKPRLDRVIGFLKTGLEWPKKYVPTDEDSKPPSPVTPPPSPASLDLSTDSTLDTPDTLDGVVSAPANMEILDTEWASDEGRMI
jgi:hypothetical protein